jgi:hypothetical protein
MKKKRAEIKRLRQELSRIADECDALREDAKFRSALVELLSCKDLKDALELASSQPGILPAELVEKMRADYGHRKELAWAAAREAIEEDDRLVDRP